MTIKLTKLTQANGESLYVYPEDILVIESSTKAEESDYNSAVLYGSGAELNYVKLSNFISSLDHLYNSKVRLMTVGETPDQDREMYIPREWIKSIEGLKDQSKVRVTFPHGIQTLLVKDSSDDIYSRMETEND